MPLPEAKKVKVLPYICQYSCICLSCKNPIQMTNLEIMIKELENKRDEVIMI